MMNVFVVFADDLPFPGLPGSAVDRKILHVVDSEEKARALVEQIRRQKIYEDVDFDVFDLE
jgi:hypothetical protein